MTTFDVYCPRCRRRVDEVEADGLAFCEPCFLDFEPKPPRKLRDLPSYRQVDIFGRDVPTELEPPRYMRRDAGVGTQSRLFEPQMEGQLSLEMRTAPEGADRGATTT